MRVEHPDTQLPNVELASEVSKAHCFDDFDFPESCWMTAPDLPTLLSALKILDPFVEGGEISCLDSACAQTIYDKIRCSAWHHKTAGVSHAAAVNLLASDVLWSFSCHADHSIFVTEVYILDWDTREAESRLRRSGPVPYTTHVSHSSHAAAADAEAQFKAFVKYVSTLKDNDFLSPWRVYTKRAESPSFDAREMQSRAREHMRAISEDVLRAFGDGQPDQDGLLMSLTDNQLRSFELSLCEVPKDLGSAIQHRLDGTDTTTINLASVPDCLSS